MDWALAIRRNREALERVLAALVAVVGAGRLSPPIAGEKAKSTSWPSQVSDFARGGMPVTLPRHLHGYALRILRAAESAIRRLVVIAAREVTVQLLPAGEGMRPDLAFLRKGMRKEPAAADAAALRIPAFALLDPLKRYCFKPRRRGPKSFPRICVVGITEPAPIPVKPVLSPDDPVDAAGLCRRLLSSRRALKNLPREARRLARWNARNKLKLSQSQGQGRGRISPLRIGRPPGGRKHPVHAVDDILKECQALAQDVLDPPDTS